MHHGSKSLVVPERGAPAAESEVPFRREVTFIQAFTLVIWLTCIAVGLLSWWLERAMGPPQAPPPAPPIQAQTMKVEMIQQPMPLVQAPTPDTPPEIAPEPVAQEVPPLPVVALPSPSIAFALPVEGPVRIVSAAMAVPVARRTAPAPPKVQRLVFGQNELPQPNPQYPPEAIAAQEEGVVGVRFTVAPDGSVSSAEITSPSRWPLLNSAALYAVLHTWHFRQGPPRIYDYRFTFRFNQS